MVGHLRKPDNAPPNWKAEDDLLGVTVAGGIAGALTWFVSLPFDVVKTRLQTMSGPVPGAWAMTRHIWRTEGLPAFFRGGVACIVRAFPANGVQFLGYEMTIEFFNRHLMWGAHIYDT